MTKRPRPDVAFVMFLVIIIRIDEAAVRTKLWGGEDDWDLFDAFVMCQTCRAHQPPVH